MVVICRIFMLSTELYDILRDRCAMKFILSVKPCRGHFTGVTVTATLSGRLQDRVLPLCDPWHSD